MGDGFGVGRLIFRELGLEFGFMGLGIFVMEDGFVFMFLEVCEKEVEFVFRRFVVFRMGVRFRF